MMQPVVNTLQKVSAYRAAQCAQGWLINILQPLCKQRVMNTITAEGFCLPCWVKFSFEC